MWDLVDTSEPQVLPDRPERTEQPVLRVLWVLLGCLEFPCEENLENRVPRAILDSKDPSGTREIGENKDSRASKDPKVLSMDPQVLKVPSVWRVLLDPVDLPGSRARKVPRATVVHRAPLDLPAG